MKGLIPHSPLITVNYHEENIRNKTLSEINVVCVQIIDYLKTSIVTIGTS